jgi:hypothetical protein
MARGFEIKPEGLYRNGALVVESAAYDGYPACKSYAIKELPKHMREGAIKACEKNGVSPSDVRLIERYLVPVEQADEWDAMMERLSIKRGEDEANSFEVCLSTRGWGDYDGVKVTLDKRSTRAEMLAVCRGALNSAIDVDRPNQTDEELNAAIDEELGEGERAAQAKAKEERREYYDQARDLEEVEKPEEQNETILTAYEDKGERVSIKFDGTGWEIIGDTRKDKGKSSGYLHCYFDSVPAAPVSARAVTEAVRDQMIQYYYNHDIRSLPGIGATPQARYFRGLTIEEKEAIGNNGKKSYYAAHPEYDRTEEPKPEAAMEDVIDNIMEA